MTKLEIILKRYLESKGACIVMLEYVKHEGAVYLLHQGLPQPLFRVLDDVRKYFGVIIFFYSDERIFNEQLWYTYKITGNERKRKI